ncbi:MAG: hypothetical protein JXB00_05290 [Bacteroidales bacterium]|nr:hypothetical protein [Bacteroidales bacterium]
MKKTWPLLSFVFYLFPIPLCAQSEPKSLSISELRWELDYQIYLKLANDSAYNYDIRQLFHITPSNPGDLSDYVYYPVNLGADYINSLSAKEQPAVPGTGHKTLWSALHAVLGGGWPHFTNCLLYSLETRQLSLTAPLMKRPVTKWKPTPMTESYRRTKGWDYYTPVGKKETIKEYKIRESQNELGDLSGIPAEYIELALKTSDKEIERLKGKGENNTIAKIELVKLLLGINFLGEAQINYISAAVLNAVKSYSENKLPSVIIFDEFDAAAVMSLSTSGYQIDDIVFKESAGLSETDKKSRTEAIAGIINNINEYNHNSFVNRLGNYYRN